MFMRSFLSAALLVAACTPTPPHKEPALSGRTKFHLQASQARSTALSPTSPAGSPSIAGEHHHRSPDPIKLQHFNAYLMGTPFTITLTQVSGLLEPLR